MIMHHVTFRDLLIDIDYYIGVDLDFIITGVVWYVPVSILMGISNASNILQNESFIITAIHPKEQ